MATGQMNGVIQHLRRAMLLRDGAGRTDGELLREHLSRRDEAALAALVHRHGPMVWGVCRRVLPNHHDAEDAFQATFLVLVRKAASIASPEQLANWLYGVANQTALKARATTAKRRTRERQVTEMPEPAVTEPDLWNDLQPLLDQELSRLSDKYRIVILLCDLEGKTRKEAARQLGLPEGTIGSRLARARVLLAKRLTERGVTLSGGALAAVLSQNVASASVPAAVVSETIKAVNLLAAGQTATGLISVKVATLTEGVLKMMLLNKLKTIPVVLLLVGLLGLGTADWLLRSSAQEKTQPTPIFGKATPPAKAGKQAKGDHVLIQGEWQLIRAVDSGRVTDDKEVLGIKLVFTKESAVLTFPSQKKVEMSYQLDPSKAPKWIDFTKDKDDSRNAIYELKGNTLKIVRSRAKLSYRFLFCAWMNFIVPLTMEIVANDHTLIEFFVGNLTAFFITRFV